MRTVKALLGWPYEFRARVYFSHRTVFRGRPKWRFDIEKYWTHWSHYLTSRPYDSEEEAKSAANRWLDKAGAEPEGECV